MGWELNKIQLYLLNYYLYSVNKINELNWHDLQYISSIHINLNHIIYLQPKSIMNLVYSMLH